MTAEFYKGLERFFDIVMGILFSSGLIASSPTIIEIINSIGAVNLIVLSYFVSVAAYVSCLIHSSWEE